MCLQSSPRLAMRRRPKPRPRSKRLGTMTTKNFPLRMIVRCMIDSCIVLSVAPNPSRPFPECLARIRKHTCKGNIRASQRRVCQHGVACGGHPACEGRPTMHCVSHDALRGRRPGSGVGAGGAPGAQERHVRQLAPSTQETVSSRVGLPKTVEIIGNPQEEAKQKETWHLYVRRPARASGSSRASPVGQPFCGSNTCSSRLFSICILRGRAEVSRTCVL